MVSRRRLSKHRQESWGYKWNIKQKVRAIRPGVMDLMVEINLWSVQWTCLCTYLGRLIIYVVLGRTWSSNATLPIVKLNLRRLVYGMHYFQNVSYWLTFNQIGRYWPIRRRLSLAVWPLNRPIKAVLMCRTPWNLGNPAVSFSNLQNTFE